MRINEKGSLVLVETLIELSKFDFADLNIIESGIFPEFQRYLKSRASGTPCHPPRSNLYRF